MEDPIQDYEMGQSWTHLCFVFGLFGESSDYLQNIQGRGSECESIVSSNKCASAIRLGHLNKQ